MGLFSDILTPEPRAQGLFAPPPVGLPPAEPLDPGFLTPDEQAQMDARAQAVLAHVTPQQATSRQESENAMGLFQNLAEFPAGFASGLLTGGTLNPMEATNQTAEGPKPVFPVGGVEDPNRWLREAGTQVGFVLGPGKVAAALSPPLKGAVSVLKRMAPWAALGGVQGAVEGIQQPDATLGSVAESAAIGGVTQGLFGGVLDVGHLGVRRLFRPPSGLPSLGGSPTGKPVRAAAAEVLGVSRTATDADVRTAYRDLARQYHPDVNPDPAASGIMAKINDAFAVLMNPETRPGVRLYSSLVPIPPEVIRAAGVAAKVSAEQIAAILARVEGGDTLAKAMIAAGLAPAVRRAMRKALAAAPEPLQAPPISEAPAAAAASSLPAGEAVGPVKPGGAATPKVAPATPNVAAPAPAGKQAWEMGFDEYWQQESGLGSMARREEAINKKHNGLKRAASRMADARFEARRIHAIEIEEAIQKGLSVTPEAKTILSEFAGEPWAASALAALEGKPPAKPPAQDMRTDRRDSLRQVIDEGRRYNPRALRDFLDEEWAQQALVAEAELNRDPRANQVLLEHRGEPWADAALAALEAKPPAGGAAAATEPAPQMMGATPLRDVLVLPDSAKLPPGSTVTVERKAAQPKGEGPFAQAYPAHKSARVVLSKYSREAEDYLRQLGYQSEWQDKTGTRFFGPYATAAAPEPAPGAGKEGVSREVKLTNESDVPEIAAAQREGIAAAAENLNRPTSEQKTGAVRPVETRAAAREARIAERARVAAEKKAARGAARDVTAETAGTRRRGGAEREAKHPGQMTQAEFDRAARDYADRLAASHSMTPLHGRGINLSAGIGKYITAEKRLRYTKAGKRKPEFLTDPRGNWEVARELAVQDAVAQGLPVSAAPTGGKPPAKPPAPPAATPAPEPEPEPKPKQEKLTPPPDERVMREEDEAEIARLEEKVVTAKDKARAEKKAKREAVAKAIETGRANVASLMLRLKAKRQSEEDIRAGLIAVLKRMPEGIRGKLLARVREAINEKRVASALEQAWKYLTERHQRMLIRAAKKTAGKIRKARLEFDKDAPILKVADDAWTKLKREMMKAIPGETPEDVVARLLDLKNSLIEAWHEHRNAKTLYTLQGMASAEDAVRSVQKDIERYAPKQPGTGKGVMPATPERGMAARGEALARKTDTLIEGTLGPWDGVLDTMLVHNLGVNIAGKHYADWYAVRDPMNAAAKKASGGKLLSEKDLRWKEEALTFDVGGKSVTAERRFWMLLRAVFKDEDAAGRWLKRTEAENPEPATFVWSTRLGDVAGSFKSADEAYTWADAYDAADPKGGQYVDDVLAALNAPGRFERSDGVHRQVYGTRLEQVPGTRVPTRYNVAAEKQPRIPDFNTETPQNILRHLSQSFARKPGGRGVSMVIGDFDQVVLTDAWESAAFNNYAPALRDAWTLLAQMVEHGERPITFEAWLAERVGRDVPAKLQQQIRHVAAQVGLAPRMRADTGGVDPAFRRLLHNAQGAAVSGGNIGPPINQVPPVILPMADTARPMKLSAFLGALKDFAAGGWREAVDTLKRLRPDIRFRAELADVQQHISPSVSSPTGYGANRLWRRVQKAIRVTGRPMIFMDLWNRAIQFIAARRQLAAEKPGLKGEALDQAAADLAAWWMYRVDAPMHPAYETTVGRAARESTAVAALTAFTQGRIAGWQVILRAIDDFSRTGDTKALARRLGVAVLGLAALFTAGGALIAVLSGRKPGEGRGGIAGDMAENAIGQVYGGQELARLLRGKTPVVSSPPLQAMERFGRGVASMHGAIEKGDRTRMLGASVNMIRGAAHLAGIPTNQVANLVRLVRAHSGDVAAPAAPSGMASAVLAASGPAGSVESLRGRMTLAAARTLLRKLARERKMDPKELAERLKRLTDRWRGRAAA